MQGLLEANSRVVAAIGGFEPRDYFVVLEQQCIAVPVDGLRLRERVVGVAKAGAPHGGHRALNAGEACDVAQAHGHGSPPSRSSGASVQHLRETHREKGEKR